MKRNFYLLLIVFFSFFAQHAAGQIITTIAGGDSSNVGDGGPATACGFYHPASIAIDTFGNYYIADRDYNRIRKVDVSGIITTIAGTGTAGFSGDNGPASAAEISHPYGIALDNLGNIYFTDAGNHRARKIDKLGIITTIAGNGIAGYNGDGIPATLAQLNFPGGLILDKVGNIYISDCFNNRVRKVDVSGIITTIAGTGSAGYNGDNIAATNADLYNPEGNVIVDNIGNIYISDYRNSRIRKINTSGVITTIAGTGVWGYSGDNGPATQAELYKPVGLAIDRYANIYIADVSNNCIRKIDNLGIISTIAGNDSLGFAGDGDFANLAKLFYPTGIAFDKHENMYIADMGNNRIRFVSSVVSVKNNVLTEDNIELYPNPTGGNFNIIFKTKTDEKVDYAISNAIGVKILNGETVTNKNQLINLDATPGLYLIEARTITQSFLKKIVISK